MLHRVRDLSPEQKVAIEALLGRAVSNDEAVSVRAINPAEIVALQPSPAERAAALRRLDQYFADVDAKRAPVSEEQEEEIVLRAIRSVRPGFRPLE